MAKLPGTSFSPLVAILVVLVGCESRAQPVPVAAETPVRIATVRHSVRALPIRTGGRLAPKTRIPLSFKTGGLVEKLYVDEGDAVEAGQLLATLDLSEINARLNQAERTFERAQRDLRRMEGLYRDSVATLEQVQNARTAYDFSSSELEVAHFNRTYSEIRAPADGRILKRKVEAHELVSAGVEVVSLGASEAWVVRAGLADRDVVKLNLGDTARLRFDAFPGAEFQGWVSEIAASADPLTGTFEVEVTVASTGHRFKEGFIARVDLFPRSREPFAIIPAEALVEADGLDGIVFTLDEATRRVHRQPVRIAHVLNDSLAISDGPESAPTVVTDGAAYLHDGDRVSVAR